MASRTTPTTVSGVLVAELLTVPAQGMSACESVRERGVKILNKEEIEGMRKVCRVSTGKGRGVET